MSYSAHRRKALDPAQLLPHRFSHARSMAVHMSQKYGVSRSEILNVVWQICGVDLEMEKSEEELVAAVRALDQIKATGLGASRTAEDESDKPTA